MRTLYRRVRLVAIWRRPKLAARGDPYHDHVVAGIVARLLELPRRAVVLAEDETHLNLLPHVRSSWTPRGARPQVLTPGKNRKVTVLGALEVSTGAWVYRLGRRCAADFIALLDQVLAAFPQAPAVVVICDNDSIQHARKVTAYLDKHPRLELLYGARYSPPGSTGRTSRPLTACSRFRSPGPPPARYGRCSWMLPGPGPAQRTGFGHDRDPALPRPRTLQEAA